MAPGPNGHSAQHLIARPDVCLEMPIEVCVKSVVLTYPALGVLDLPWQHWSLLLSARVLHIVRTLVPKGRTGIAPHLHFPSITVPVRDFPSSPASQLPCFFRAITRYSAYGIQQPPPLSGTLRSAGHS